MEATLEFPELLKERDDSTGKINGHDPALSKENDTGAVKNQHGDPSMEDSGQHPLDMSKTLGRQFEEYWETADTLSLEEQQRSLLAFMPLFLKAWDQSEGTISFPKIHFLAGEVSNLLVEEIRRNINGKSAGEPLFGKSGFVAPGSSCELCRIILAGCHGLATKEARGKV
uniref:Uncharacterized protein n=1 Tax=Sphaerodactylus townsendi TaxID=933632 RepID=A0ACB8F8V5_9SAUR